MDKNVNPASLGLLLTISWTSASCLPGQVKAKQVWTPLASMDLRWPPLLVWAQPGKTGWLIDKSNPFQWFSGIFWEENSIKIWAFCWLDRSGLGLCDLGIWDHSHLILEIQIDDGRVLGYGLNLHHPYTWWRGRRAGNIVTRDFQCSQWGLASPPCLTPTPSTSCPHRPPHCIFSIELMPYFFFNWNLCFFLFFFLI